MEHVFRLVDFNIYSATDTSGDSDDEPKAYKDNANFIIHKIIELKNKFFFFNSQIIKQSS